MLERLLQFVFPPKCVFCGSILQPGTPVEICGACRGRIYPGNMGMGMRSGRNDAVYGIDGVVCACQYAGIIKETVKRYKFYNRPSYHRALAKLLADELKKMTNYCDFDIILSVPLHRSRLRSRGYNQAALIAKAVSREVGIRYDGRVLERVRNTSAQSLLKKDERYINIKGAFKVVEAFKIKGANVLLVDDVMTTGSTIGECCRVLKEAGACSVVAAVVASGHK